MAKRPTIIVLAESYGEELKKWGPKCLITLAEPYLSRKLTILDWHQHVLRPDIIVTGCGHRDIKNWKDDLFHLAFCLVRNKNWESTNQCAGAALALSRTKAKDVVLLFGDLVFSSNLAAKLLDKSCIVTDTSKRMAAREVGVTVVDDEATQFSYGLPLKWGQIVRLKGVELEIFREVVADPRTTQWFLFEALNRVLNAGGRLKAIQDKSIKIVDVDQKKDIARARKLVKSDEISN